ncbi:protein FAM3A-like [Heteronotia binoei]|uniref:protein FAM3A-like n=1 Tax=Heteronotia binoei TaxID=13085 RepID=UPI00292F38F4|nr:protein FAM3A-like [Heteronotia binoei]
MRLAGPLRGVIIILTAGLTWILVSVLLGTQSGFSCLQQLLNNPENPPSTVPYAPISSPATFSLCVSCLATACPEPRPNKYKCGLPQACLDQTFTFKITSGTANVIGPKICLEDKMLMSSVKNNMGRGLNIALMNRVNGELIDAKSFNMWAGDVTELLKFIRPLHEGTLVFMASYDDPATKTSGPLRSALWEHLIQMGNTSP